MFGEIHITDWSTVSIKEMIFWELLSRMPLGAPAYHAIKTGWKGKPENWFSLHLVLKCNVYVVVKN